MLAFGPGRGDRDLPQHHCRHAADQVVGRNLLRFSKFTILNGNRTVTVPDGGDRASEFYAVAKLGGKSFRETAVAADETEDLGRPQRHAAAFENCGVPDG